MDTGGNFYLGRLFDLEKGDSTGQPLLYDPEDLTTHAVVVGMTGSGKTGLCINLLEEAALQGIPAIMIDPKGDITNSLLHFPDLAPQDFQPWINADHARRTGQTVQEAAQEAAKSWQSGLAEWGIGKERIQALKNAAGFTVFTPGSSSGVPVSVLASFKAPQIPWEENRELLHEKISGTVTALLALVGMDDIDPVRSREHILLSNIFEHAWSSGKDLDMGELILQTQTPSFTKLGVFDLDTFFPAKDRFELAMLLNNILASPGFQSWIEGEVLDIQKILYLPDGRPRHNIFYIAHLTDVERMFFVTLLYSAVETWMRTQPGTTSLRAILYFDEIYGYLPPVGNPPSKQPMLGMLKQARAFGVGQVFVTQNPVDLDYKALSNAGTWMIGKLQTEQDKARLLDGLTSASGGALDRRKYDDLISALGQRVFLLHNVHDSEPKVFQTRWAMNYLPGPLTRVQIPLLNNLAGVGSGPREVPPGKSVQEPAGSTVRQALFDSAVEANDEPVMAAFELGSETRPAVPGRAQEYFLANDLTLAQALKRSGQPYPEGDFNHGILYRPALLAQVHIRFLERKYNLDQEVTRTALVVKPDRRGMVRWENYKCDPVGQDSLDYNPIPQGRFAPLEGALADRTVLASLKSDFQDWVYRMVRINVKAHPGLGIYAGPDVSQAEFRQMCAEEARQRRDAEIDKLAAGYEKKLDRLEDRLEREMRELDEDETELSQRKMEEFGTHAENVLSIFSKRRRRLTTSLTKRRLTAQAKADVEESRKAIKNLEEQMEALEEELAVEIEELKTQWGETAMEAEEISVSAYKKNILVDLFGVAWVPYHVIQVEGHAVEIAGFSTSQIG